ncbi:MAG: AAA family ATPase, partial [Oscillospiraceae bacterium]|nr:AAA family ATPase [Oscillospiraceae bacterium]
MKIYSMTATFGKLENQTLTLNPGLNIIQAPNEWGKSTWCAFLLNMLYGIDTRERVAQGSIPAKDRYAPWSGRPMSGKIELCWNGRDITIERSSNPRTPLGDFRAYETATGV